MNPHAWWLRNAQSENGKESNRKERIRLVGIDPSWISRAGASFLKRGNDMLAWFGDLWQWAKRVQAQDDDESENFGCESLRFWTTPISGTVEVWSSQEICGLTRKTTESNKHHVASYCSPMLADILREHYDAWEDE